jgi:hypothetical protein
VSEPQGTPWERRSEIGFVSALMQTIQQALFEPSKLFRSAKLDQGSAQLGFAVLVSSVASIAGQLVSLPFRSGSTRVLSNFIDTYLAGNPAAQPLKNVLMQTQGTALQLILGVIFAPIFSLIFVYLNAAVTHLFALLFGQSKRGFPATFAACAYAFAPTVLLIVPGCGWLIAIAWVVVLTGIGLKETHGMSTGGATISVLAPYLAICCMGMLSISALAWVLSRAMAGAQ